MQEKKIILQNKKSDLKELVSLMNKQNKRPFPTFNSFLNAIDFVLTEDELDLLLKMGTDLYSYEQAAALSGISGEKFKSMFESLKQKGFLRTKYTETEEERYTLNPIVVGWFEAQVSHLIGKPKEKEFARRYMVFFDSLRNLNFFPIRNIMNLMTKYARVSNQSVGLVHESKDSKGKTTLVMNRTINVPDSKIYPTKSVNDLILEYGSKSLIGQFTCMCRRVTSNIGDPCRLKMPDDGGCMGFGDLVRPLIKYGHARQISKEQAFEVIQKVRDKGAIHTVFHEKDDTNLPQIGLCNCCWDCCGIFRSYNMGAVPLRYSCYYMAKIVDSSKCNGCTICEKYCPTAAISVVDDKATINAKKCIGCGQCVHQCSRSAVELIENKRTAFLPMLKKSEARIKT
jgi:Dissimilatory sulfite reductase (desulfoviridin), alpha and beta subunits